MDACVCVCVLQGSERRLNRIKIRNQIRLIDIYFFYTVMNRITNENKWCYDEFNVFFSSYFCSNEMVEQHMVWDCVCVFGCASLATYNCIVVTNQKPIQFIACRRHINDIICDQYSQMIPLNHQSFPYFISTLIQTIHYAHNAVGFGFDFFSSVIWNVYTNCFVLRCYFESVDLWFEFFVLCTDMATTTY